MYAPTWERSRFCAARRMDLCVWALHAATSVGYKRATGMNIDVVTPRATAIRNRGDRAEWPAACEQHRSASLYSYCAEVSGAMIRASSLHHLFCRLRTVWGSLYNPGSRSSNSYMMYGCGEVADDEEIARRARSLLHR